MDKAQELKEWEKLIVNGMKCAGLIGDRFTGQITLHFNDGSICDIDKLEKGLKKRIIS